MAKEIIGGIVPRFIYMQAGAQRGLEGTAGGIRWSPSSKGTGLWYDYAICTCDGEEILAPIEGLVVDSICFEMEKRSFDDKCCFLLLTKDFDSSKYKLHFIETCTGVKIHENSAEVYWGASVWYSTEIGLKNVNVESNNVICFYDNEGNKCFVDLEGKTVVALGDKSIEVLYKGSDLSAKEEWRFLGGQISNEKTEYEYNAKVSVCYDDKNQICSLGFKLISSENGWTVELVSVSFPLEKVQLESDESMVWELIKQAFEFNGISCVDNDLTEKVIAMRVLSQLLYGNTKPPRMGRVTV